MRMLAEEDYETRVREMGAYFLEGLRELKSRYAIIGDVDGLGLALRAEICAADELHPRQGMMDRIVDEGIKATSWSTASGTALSLTWAATIRM